MATSSLTNITHVSFDADGTLWDFESTMEGALEVSLAQIRDRHDAAAGLTINRLREIREEVACEMPHPAHSLEEIRFLAFARTLEQIEHADLEFARELTRDYLDFRFEKAVLFPETRPVLKALSPQFALGVISNGNSYPERCGLPNTFDFQIFSTVCGVAKPDPRIFEIALERIDCSPEQLLHIGDSPSDDIACPRALGIRTIWVNREGISLPSSCDPDFTIGSLAELPDLLGRSLRRTASGHASRMAGP